MPRRSSRAAPASPQAPRAAPKRRASARLSTSQAEIKRVKSNVSLAGRPVKSTAKKSKYFEPESSVEPGASPSQSDEDESGSAYDAKDSDGSSENFSVPDEPSDGEEASKKSRLNAKQARSAATDEDVLKHKELWREGVRTGLGPGKEVFIPKPKARDPGNVPYRDETLHPNTKRFLQDLAKNNDRGWLKGHDPDYRAAKKDFETFVETLTTKITEKDSTVPELPVKDLVFRIHRDIRFSKNPLPYKIHFSAAWSRTGKKGPYAAYYVHFQPGSCFVGCGLWHPEAGPLATLREDIDENADRWKGVLRAPAMRREFLKGVSDDDDAVVKVFADANKESALKTKPKRCSYRHLDSYCLSMVAEAARAVGSLVAWCVIEDFIDHPTDTGQPNHFCIHFNGAAGTSSHDNASVTNGTAAGSWERRLTPAVLDASHAGSPIQSPIDWTDHTLLGDARQEPATQGRPRDWESTAFPASPQCCPSYWVAQWWRKTRPARGCRRERQPVFWNHLMGDGPVGYDFPESHAWQVSAGGDGRAPALGRRRTLRLRAVSSRSMGYDADNENIQLLRLRSFTLGRPVSDTEMLAADAQDRIVALVEVMEPFVSLRPPSPVSIQDPPTCSPLLSLYESDLSAPAICLEKLLPHPRRFFALL
ncbi:uncharacterized protein N7482_004930 [Penicillium canariense]|uniref:Uncharacterized protein n=1 Tax=Penicillium canariense TaxID=189055 RepID=A0A9W9LLQ6_9EURO|nr:uncharacterized protein N7482_004930 [Penicillium canariense]KAJ5166149.1 hypothetical protein N7482_004930 [Penicillium canariense]